MNQREYQVDRRRDVISTYINVESTLGVCWERTGSGVPLMQEGRRHQGGLGVVHPTPRPPPPSPLPPFTFLSRKKKKERQRQKRKGFKAETIKRLSPRSNYYCFSHSRASRIQKFFLSINHGGQQYFPVFHGPTTFKSISPPLCKSVRYY